MKPKVIFLELNEANFELIREYVEKYEDLPNFKKIFKNELIETESESIYEHLEPWIQWVSAHTGLEMKDHNIFRLGDIVNSDLKQIYESIEERGYKVGAVSPMNTKNSLKNPCFFIPDPWTNTAPDNYWYSRYLSEALTQVVNDNSQSKIKISSLFKLAAASFYLLSPTKLINLFIKATESISVPWKRASFLDYFLIDIYIALLKKHDPDFSSIFLNGIAHIQHHYMLSSSNIKTKYENPYWYDKNRDPLHESLRYYDSIIEKLTKQKYKLIIATGLTQVPCKRPVYYYRLKAHESFFSKLNFDFESIEPRMTRDFLVKFDNNNSRDHFQKSLSKITLNKKLLFGEVEARDKELFISMDYDDEILPSDKLHLQGLNEMSIHDEVVFVAIKNGEHSAKGYFITDSELPNWSFGSNSHVASIHNYLLSIYK